MKQFLFLLLLVFASVTFTGCFDIIEEIFLKKDGSGEYVTTIDFSKAPAALESMFNKDKEDNLDSEGKVDNDTFENIDSIITFEEMIADRTDEQKAKIERLEFWKERLQMRMKMDKEAQTMLLQLVFKFDSFEDVNYYSKHFGNIMEEEENQGMNSQIMNMASSSYLKMKGKKLIQTGTVFNPDEVFDNGEFQMIKMMAGKGTIKTIFHLEQKVKKVKNKNSVISEDGKTVTTTFPLTDYLEGKIDMSNQLKLR